MMIVKKSAFKIDRLILTCFFMSGFASLIYEVVWTRMMVLIFGATTLAISTVLTVFMGGLALGSLIFGRMASRCGHPIIVYAVLEIIIGVYGLIIPWILPFLVPLYQIAWQTFHQDFYLFNLARFFLVSTVLIIPTTLMGATLPVVGQYFSNRESQAGRYLGLLYGLNTIGAVAGTFSAGYILLPALGVQQSTLAAALANFLVGVVAMIAWKKTRWSDQAAVSRENEGKGLSAPSSLPTVHSPLTTRTALIILSVFALSGFSAMVYEVTWSRTLSLIMGSTLYAFSAMLATFLVGLSLGSLVSSLVVERLRNPLRAIGILQVFIGVFSFLTMSLMTEMPYLFVSIYSYWLPSATWMPLLWFIISFLTMFIPTLLFGALFPLVVKLFQGKLWTMGRLAGDIYAINTLGAIVGSFSAGFILIPAIGIQSSVMIAVYLNILLGLVVLHVDPAPHRRMVTFSILTLGVFMFLIKPAWDPRVMTSGVFMNLSDRSQLLIKEGRQRFYEELGKGQDTLFLKEGMTATITVEKDPVGGVALRVNGRREAGGRFLRTQVLLGHLPMLFKPKIQEHIEKVLVIGWGSGVTVGSLARYPVERIVAVELESAILEANRFFEQMNRMAMKDPRVEVVVNDGRNYLLVTPEKFDVIISQPSLPWVTGASNLFTEEFFRLGANRLKAGGVFCQWISSDVIDLEDLQSVIRAFKSSFSNVLIFQAVPGDLVLLGSLDSWDINLDAIQLTFLNKPIQEDLRRIGVSSIWDLLALYQFEGSEVEQLIKENVSNTDDNAVVEIMGPVHYYTKTSRKHKLEIRDRLEVHHAQELAEGGHLISKQSKWDRRPAYLLLARAVEKVDPVRALLYINASMKNSETAEAYYAKGQLLLSLVDRLQPMASGGSPENRQKMIEEAFQSLEKSLQLGLPNPVEMQVRYDLAEALWNEGFLEKAAEQYEAILTEESSFEAHSNLGAIYLQIGRLTEALHQSQQALKIAPNDPQIYFKIGLIFSKMGRYAAAIDAYKEAIRIAPNDLETHLNLAVTYEQNQHPVDALKHYQHFLKLVPQDQEYVVQRNSVETRIRQLSVQNKQRQGVESLKR